MSALAHAWPQLRLFGVLLDRNLRQVGRIPTVVVFGVVMPVVQLLLFGSIFSATTSIPGNPYAGANYYAYIAPAILLLTAFLGMANVSAALIVDLRTGYFDKLRTTPANPGTILAARIAGDMVRVTAQCLIVLALTLALGAWPSTGVPGMVAMVVLPVVFSACTVAPLFMTLALRTRSDQATQSAFPLLFIFLFLSTAYMPKPLLPEWLQTVVDYNPLDYIIRALRDLMFTGWPLAEIGVALVASGVGAVVLGAVLWRTHRATSG
jgi:ABC-2 type transport system permease protein